MEQAFKYKREKDGDICDLVLYQYGREDCMPSHSYGPAQRKFYLMHFVYEGTGIFEADGKTYHLSPGQCFMIFPDETTYYEADAKDPWTYYWVGFSGASADRILSRCGIDRENRIADVGNSDSVKNHFEEMIACPQNEARSEMLMMSKLYGLLSELVITGEFDVRDYAQTAARYMRRNFSSPITVEGIADMMNIDRTTLYRAFVKIMKCSPAEYLLRIRLERAAEYLKKTNLPIVQICFSCGFNDANYFCKIFKKYYGATPSSYRKIPANLSTFVLE